MKKVAFILATASIVILGLLSVSIFILMLADGWEYESICSFCLLIPITWMYPISMECYKSMVEEYKLSFALKLYYLLLVNPIGGILLLCDKEDAKEIGYNNLPNKNKSKVNGVLTSRLLELENLKYNGLITEEEYNIKKKQTLGL